MTQGDAGTDFPTREIENRVHKGAKIFPGIHQKPKRNVARFLFDYKQTYIKMLACISKLDVVPGSGVNGQPAGLGGREAPMGQSSCEWPHAPGKLCFVVQLRVRAAPFHSSLGGPNEMLHITCPVDLHIMSLL